MMTKIEIQAMDADNRIHREMKKGERVGLGTTPLRVGQGDISATNSALWLFVNSSGCGRVGCLG